jgi:cephalosporin hydroxylase
VPAAVGWSIDEPMRAYWADRLRQHTTDSYAGVPMSKFPEDLRTYEHLIWHDRPDTVVELGVHVGGSVLWFRDRLRALRSYGRSGDVRVIGVDRDLRAARERLADTDPRYTDSIHLVEGDLSDPRTVQTVRDLVAGRCLVIEDSAHEYATTAAALHNYAPLVHVGGFFVVEDGCVDLDDRRIDPDWPRGVLPALADWLVTEPGRAFTVRQDLELYGMTCHPGGFLQRVS